MSNKLQASPFVVTLNTVKTVEYFRDRSLTEKQQHDLIAADEKLNQGIHLAGEFIQHPSDQDKAIFMANLIVNALNNDDDATIALACSFLATRYVHLKQLKISSHEDRVSIELINDQQYADPIPIKFIPKNDLL